MEEKKENNEQSKNKSKENNPRRNFLKIAAVTAGGFALVATMNSVVRVPFLGNGQDASAGPIVAAAPVPPEGLTPFVDALVIPPVLTPDTKKYPGKDYYEISIVPGTGHKFHRDLPATTMTQSYFATAPVPGVFHYLGATIVAQSGRPVKLKVTNKLKRGPHQIHQPLSAAGDPMDYTIMGTTQGYPVATMTPWKDEHRVCVHLHGGKVLTQHDGRPRDWFSPVGSKQANPYPEGEDIDPKESGSHTYEYPNDQAAAMLWYHDHAWGITRFNPFLGQAAAYIVRDNGENKLINAGEIPKGPYEVPIVLQDRLLDLETGDPIYPPTTTPGTHPQWIPEYFGNIPIVNGRAFPFFNVEPRRYRFRFINGSQARFYNIWFQGESSPTLPIWVIGSEQGFLPKPVKLTNLVIAPGERFDTIIDFTGMKTGSTLTLMNNANEPYPDGESGNVLEIMQFKLVPRVGKDTTSLPQCLKLPPIDPPLTKPSKSKWREIVISEIADPVTGEPLEALLDGQNFTESAPPNPPLFTEDNGATNIWQFINTTGDAHPMHLHLVKFKIVNRQMFDSEAFLVAWDAWIAAGRRKAKRPSVKNFLQGEPTSPEPEETGWKDTAKANPGEVLSIIAKFDLPADAPTGTNIYVCHCHILEHEENDMMFYYGVQKHSNKEDEHRDDDDEHRNSNEEER